MPLQGPSLEIYSEWDSKAKEGLKSLGKFKSEDKDMLTGAPKAVNSLSPHINPVSVSSQFLGEHIPSLDTSFHTSST